MADIHGICSEEFSGVREVFGRNLDTGADIGASAAVFIDSEPVVDIWGGFFDEARTRPWERDTIVNMFSTTKTMTALYALILADRGELDLRAPVAKYWPECAAEGKARTEVRRFLGHTSFAEEVAGPLGADYHIGTGPECDDRVSIMIAATPPRPRDGAGTITDRVFFNPYVYPEDSGSIPWRRGELGGSNGHGNARSVALVQQVLACGGAVGDVHLLSAAGCERVFELQADGTDLVLGFALRWGMGYALGGPMVDSLYGNRFAGRRIAFWGGSGGSFVINDLDARMTVAYVMNRHVEHGFTDQRGIDLLNAAYDALMSG